MTIILDKELSLIGFKKDNSITTLTLVKVAVIQFLALSLTGFSISRTFGYVVAMFALILTLLAITFAFIAIVSNN